MPIKIFILALIVLINTGLASFIFIRTRRTEVNHAFAIAIIFMALWALTTTLSLSNSFAISPLYWSRIGYIAGLGILTAFLHFSWVFPRTRPRVRPYHKLALWLIALFFAPLPLLPGAVVIGQNATVISIAPTPLGFLYAGYLSLLLLFSIATLGETYRRAKGQTKNQLQTILTGALLASIYCLSFSVVLPILGIYNFAWLAPSSTLIFNGFIFYAIATKGLFDTRLFFRRAIVFSLLLGIILTVLILIISFTAQRLNATEPLTNETLLANIIAALLIAFSFDPLRRWLQAKSNDLLFKKEVENQQILHELATNLNYALGLDEALELVTNTILKSVKVNFAIAAVFQKTLEDELTIKQVKQIGKAHHDINLLLKNQILTAYFTEEKEIVIVDRLRQYLQRHAHDIHRLSKSGNSSSAEVRHYATKKSLVEALDSIEVAAVLPLHLNGQLIGMILLGPLPSEDPFTPTDLTFFELIAAQTVSSIERAKLYEGDQMKSEFVSVASHELLTPISAMGGYLSMILDEHIGKVDPKATDYLEKAYSSVKRLSALVKDLLAVSRIEAGRVKFNPQSVNLISIIQENLVSLAPIAKEKHLKLEVNIPDLPPLWADPIHTSTVVYNLISNAIKYTNEGGVTIAASLGNYPDPMIKLVVTDTGIGISKEQQLHLYEKFYRVDESEATGIPSTGLGLYITKGLIERMCGTITATSTLGKGTSVEVTFPLVESS